MSFCVAVGALFLWLMNTYDGEPELHKEQPEEQKGGRKRNRRKGKREANRHTADPRASSLLPGTVYRY